MQKMEFTEILSLCIEHNLPFYSYRMPQSEEIIIGIQTSQQIQQNPNIQPNATGFIIAPFHTRKNSPSFFIKADIFIQNGTIASDELATIQSTCFDKKVLLNTTIEISKEDYLIQASDLIEKLQKKKLKKVVLSRAIHNSSVSIENGVSIFEKLTQTYFHAFVSIFHIPGVAAWIGASPETLIKSHNDKIETMSLAGTKPANKPSDWTAKEREEQQMVSDYVEDILFQLEFEEIDKVGPQDLVAGNVCHLMTRYSCKGKLSANELTDLIEKLHPTPAVCGLPKAESMILIEHTEKHDRDFYAGYLGPVSPSGCDLFVNLRCMKLTDTGITLFVGGGITAQSHAEAEWQETCLKAETLLKIIKN
ncbi:MAG: chorismate-binding protein [Bacteroidales bacterium]|nr:chorismate-binding protein [Bacteroidales bacterium]